MNLLKLMGSSVRLRVFQYLTAVGEATTKQLREALPDVPAPTLYRHISAMIKERLLIVKEERKIRGGAERLLAVNTKELIEADGQGGLVNLSYQFLMALYARFYRYGAQPDADPERDLLMLRTSVLRLSDAQYTKFLTELGGLIEKYRGAKTHEDAKTRSFSVISAPAFEEQEENNEK